MAANRITRKRKGLLSAIETPGGFTLIELLIAISILTVGLLGVASMQVSAIRGNDFARAQTEAATAGMDLIEKLLRLPYDHADLAAGDHADPSPPSGYTIGWNVTDNSPLNNTKTVTVSTSWLDHGNVKTLSMRRIVPRII
jgi:prepilin-type N-terminal cleavage/methylation domain-containing protein